uniref:Uncharacterized protein n=1 Tax=Paramormyrops kingsleyae TaxID=1676925 RepID=A0A3B3QFV0_9TELE
MCFFWLQYRGSETHPTLQSAATPPCFIRLVDLTVNFIILPVNHRELQMASTPPPRDHILWSLFSFIYCNAFCLGFIALYYSVKVSARDRKVLGDLEANGEYGSKARCFNIAALCISLIILFIFIVTLGLLHYWYEK